MPPKETVSNLIFLIKETSQQWVLFFLQSQITRSVFERIQDILSISEPLYG